MVEGGLIDIAGHAWDLDNNIHETLAFAETVEVISEWAGERTDTLILVTADHETGGLTVLTNNGSGVNPTVTWSTNGHTSTPVPVYAWGLNANLTANIADNTNIYQVAVSTAIVPEQAVSLEQSGDTVESVWTSASGDVYRVEYTSALNSTNWTPLMTVTADSSRLITVDTNTEPRRFYRLISLGSP